MSKLFLIFVLISAFKIAEAQIIFSHKVDSILNQVSIQSIIRFNKELSGDTVATIGGIQRRIYSRYYSTQGNIFAQQYIYEKFQNFGLSPKLMVNNTTNINVFAVKTGVKYPGQKILMCAHYDNVKIPLPTPTDTVHGADDNASGICALLEAARLVSGLNTDYTIEFVAFDEEENGLYGSQAYADSCFARGDSILGVINLDMIGWDNNIDFKSYVFTNSNSQILSNDYIRSNQIYQIGLNIYKDTVGLIADHKSFWLKGYKALTLIEDLDDFNPHYHKSTDTFDKLNITYLYKLVKSAIATLFSIAIDSKFRIEHNPLVSTVDTLSILTTAFIHFPGDISTGTNGPRLYFRKNNGNYNFVNAYTSKNGTFYFNIPGHNSGSKIDYYIAAQDSTGNYVLTYPEGGTGANPPGTNPPANVLSYYVLNRAFYCSNTVPKQINDLQILSDTIYSSNNGLVDFAKVHININHTNDGDLFIRLKKDNMSVILSQYNGENGENYTWTLFDDKALISITQGSPPFTGNFRPQTPLGVLKNVTMEGNWIIQIYDKKTGNQGTLLNWCLELSYFNPTGVNENAININSYELKQNYPNPFNSYTKIQYTILQNSNVKVTIYDYLGREIIRLVNEWQSAGKHELFFDGSELSSGVYFYSILTNGFYETKKMLLIK